MEEKEKWGFSFTTELYFESAVCPQELSIETPIASSQTPANFDLLDFEQACKIDYRLCSATIREHLRHVGRLLTFLHCHPLQATRQELRQFLAFNPAQNAIKALRVLYGRFLDSDLAKCFKVPQSPVHLIVAPSRIQLRHTYENLNDLELETAFLLLGTSGLRRHELMELTPVQIDLEKRMILPPRRTLVANNKTKLQWITFFNGEAETKLRELLLERSPSPNERIFTLYKDTFTRKFKEASPPDFKITPQLLRDWFCCEMGKLRMPDRYVDAFCGRVPKRVLGRHYTDYSPQRLKKIYDKADLKVFGGSED